jgi:hypothetical protein
MSDDPREDYGLTDYHGQRGQRDRGKERSMGATTVKMDAKMWSYMVGVVAGMMQAVHEIGGCTDAQMNAMLQKLYHSCIIEEGSEEAGLNAAGHVLWEATALQRTDPEFVYLADQIMRVSGVKKVL